jgi:HD-GYP domain-containing protein (c-di-GMP phosphodiesterase class II)
MAMRVPISDLLSFRAAVRAAAESDPTRSSHESRVAIVAATVAGAMGLGDGEQQAIVTCALLHDLGKSLLPRALCEKPGPLTSPEWTLMRRHPEMSEQIAQGFVSSPYVLGSIRSHHERWDGTGYPDRTAGPATPLAARIFAVADSLDAMTETRPYRAPVDWEEAVGEIAGARGSQFDPEAVDALVACERDLHAVYDETRAYAA